MRENLIILILIMGFVSYLLSFPLFGPLTTNLQDAEEYYTTFLLTHIVGISLGGFFVDRISRRVLVTKIIAIFLILAAASFYFGFFILAALIQGIFLGVYVVIWGSLIARIVKPWERAKTLAVGVAFANAFLLWIQYSNSSNVFLAVIPLIPVFFLPELNVKDMHVWTVNRDIFNFILPVAIFYILSGFMYAAMEPEFRSAGINVHALFYILIVLFAGYLYDRIGRKVVSIIGLSLLALSYVFFNRFLTLSAYLIQSSYGFLDVFSMIIWADLSYYGSEAKHYSIGVFTIVASILFGYKALIYYNLNPFDFESLALILLILASVSIAMVKEPMLSEEEYAARATRFGGATK